jgi:tetratricopeptide (TPR) repeat protein
MSATTIGDCPYQGLQPFSQQDAEYFAGRDNEVQIITSALYASKLIVFYGESGVGKTSVISAGVLPELSKPEHRVAALLFRKWQLPTFQSDLRRKILQALLRTINRLRGDREPISFGTLEIAFCGALRESEDAKPLSREELYHDVPLDRFMMECCAAFSGRLFFIFDQFEEYFYYHPQGSLGAEFDGALAAAVNSPDVPASFLLSLREDGLGKLDRLRRRIPHLFGNMLRLEHLDRKGIEEALRKPIPVYNRKTGRNAQVKDDLVEELIPQVREDRIGFTEEDRLPSWYVKANHESLRYKGLFLQVVLTRLWKAALSEGNEINLTLEQFAETAGGKERDESETMFIVRTYFNDMMSKLSPLQRDNASEVLRFLVRPSGQKKSRSAAQLAKDAGLERDATSLAGLTEMLDLLASDKEEFKLLNRIETRSPQEQNRRSGVPHLEPEYEIRHDVMGVALRDWCDRQRQAVQLRRQQKELDAAEELRCAQLRAQQLELDAAKNLALEQEKARQQELLAAEKLRKQELQAAETLREEQLRRQKLEFDGAEKLRLEQLRLQRLELKAAEEARLLEVAAAEKIRKYWKRALAASLAVILFLSISVYVMYRLYQVQRLQRRIVAWTAVQVVEKDVNSALRANSSPDVAILAAIDAVALCLREEVLPPPEAISDLHLATQRLANELMHRSPSADERVFVPALVSPDGQFTATVESGNTLVLWNNRTFEPVTLSQIEGDILQIGFSQEGKQVAAATSNGDVWVWNVSPQLEVRARKAARSFLEELGLSSLSNEETARYAKGDNKPWNAYGKLSRDWFIEAVKMITRKYKNKERMDFPGINFETPDRIFTERANEARELVGKNVEGAKNLFSQLLKDFHIKGGDTSEILAEMCITNAKQAFWASDLRTAITRYKQAQAINPKGGFSKKADALEELQDGYTYAKNRSFDEAAKKYHSAAELDPTLLELAPELNKTADELKTESDTNHIEKMKGLLARAFEAAKQAHEDEAIKLYQQAKEAAPDVLKELDPQTEYYKFAPKGPASGERKSTATTPEAR